MRYACKEACRLRHARRSDGRRGVVHRRAIPARLAPASAESSGELVSAAFHATRARRRSSPVPATRSSFRVRKRASPSSGVRRSLRTIGRERRRRATWTLALADGSERHSARARSSSRGCPFPLGARERCSRAASAPASPVIGSLARGSGGARSGMGAVPSVRSWLGRSEPVHERDCTAPIRHHSPARLGRLGGASPCR